MTKKSKSAEMLKKIMDKIMKTLERNPDEDKNWEGERWTAFRGKKNTNDILDKKAHELGKKIIEQASEFSNEIISEYLKELKQNTREHYKLYMPMITDTVFLFLIIARISAIDYLQKEKGLYFSERLEVETIIDLIKKLEIDDNNAPEDFNKAYYIQQKEYLDYCFTQYKGNDPIKQKILFRFSNKISSYIGNENLNIVLGSMFSVATKIRYFLRIEELLEEEDI